MESSRAEVTSEIIIRYEFLLQMPGTDKPQRYVVTVDIDSKLPLVGKPEAEMPIPWFVFRDFPSLTVSIDFIDYLCAKNFLQLVESWYNMLEVSKCPQWLVWLSKTQINWKFFFSRVGYLGAAAFIWVYLWSREGTPIDIRQLGYLAAIVVTFGIVSSAITSQLGVWFSNTIGRSLAPSAILLTTGDDRCFAEFSEKQRNSLPAMCRQLGGTLLTLLMNVIASYVYSLLTK
jgi:hypothetical protein